jgi:hypothetical protein
VTDIPIIATRSDGYRIVANVHDLPNDVPCWPVGPCSARHFDAYSVDTKHRGGVWDASTAKSLLPDPCPVLIAPAVTTERVPWHEAQGRTLPDGRTVCCVKRDDCGVIVWADVHDVSVTLDEDLTVEVLCDSPTDDIVWVPLTRRDASTISVGAGNADAWARAEKAARDALARNPKRSES